MQASPVWYVLLPCTVSHLQSSQGVGGEGISPHEDARHDPLHGTAGNSGSGMHILSMNRTISQARSIDLHRSGLKQRLNTVFWSLAEIRSAMRALSADRYVCIP